MCDRLVASFLEVEEHQKMYCDYLQNPNQLKKELIEEQFKTHVIKIKIISYFSRVFLFEAQRFDKKLRDESMRNSLILDNKEIKEEIQFDNQSSTLQEKQDFEIFLEDSNVENCFEDEKMFNIVSSLNSDNKKLLELLYIKGLSDSKVAHHLGISKQAVNKRKNSVLKNIRKFYQK